MKNNLKITELSDNELVEKIVEANNTQLFGVLYDRYVKLVYNRCLNFVRKKSEAEDLTHDIFLTVFVKLRTFKREARFSTWLYPIVYNSCITHINKSKKNETVVCDVEVEEIADKETMRQYNIYELKSDVLQKALDKIDPHDKMILLLKYQDGFTNDELEEIFELSSSGVRMRIKRAKERALLSYHKMIKERNYE